MDDFDFLELDQFDTFSLDFQDTYWVDSYVKSDGTYVSGHWKTMPDNSLSNNLSFLK